MSGMMTIQKAIKMLDWWINQKKQGIFYFNTCKT